MPELLASLPATFWPDVAKTLIGSFVGAGLAFSSNLWFQRKDRRRRDKAAGNLALSILARQYNDFLILRKGFAEERARVVGQSPNAPRWLYARPMHFYFSDGLKYDYESLAFLFDKGESGLFSMLALVEQRYHDLASLTQLFTAAAERLQEKLVGAGIRNGQDFLVTEAEEAIGHDLLGKVDSLLQGIEIRLRDDEGDYQRAAQGLRDAMVATFGKKGVVKVDTNAPQPMTGGDGRCN